MPDDDASITGVQETDSGGQGGQGGGSQKPSDQPNTDIQAPMNIIMTEGVDYSKITTRDAGKSEDKSE